MPEMKINFITAWKAYLILLTILSIVFWAYMIYDDWTFVEKYGISLEGIWYWFLWYLGYCFTGFTIFYWIVACVGFLIQMKLIKGDK